MATSGRNDPTSTPPPGSEELAYFSDATDGTLPSGPSVVIDPIVNTEPNVLDTGWIDVSTKPGKNVVGVLADTSLKVFLMNATDASGDNIFGDLAPTLVTNANFPAQLSAVYADRFYRMVVCNDSGTTASEYRAYSVAAPESTEGVTTAIDQPVFGFFPANVNRSVIMGRQPDGDYVNTPATGLAYDVDGNAIETTTPLAPSGTYQSGWIDTDGFDEIEVAVITDQVSASDGILVEFTDDANGSQTVRGTETFTFTQTDVVAGSLTVRTAPQMDGFRITYTNGGVAQGSFYLSVTLRADATSLPRAPLSGAVSGGSQAVRTKGALLAPDDLDQWSSVTQSDDGGLRTSIKEHEAKTPLASSDTFQGGFVAAAGTTPQQIATPAMTNRTSILIINNSSNRALRVAPSSAAANGANYLRIPPQGGAALPLNALSEVWVRAETSTVEFSYAEFAEVSDA